MALELPVDQQRQREAEHEPGDAGEPEPADAANDTEGAGPAYFGFVRDQRGAPVSDAQVFLKPKQGEPVALKTNVLGLYRSHVNKDTLPDDVTISCEKDGYKQDRVFRRTPPGAKDMFIETDCTLRRL